jgi:hypothetical protein
VAASIYLSAFLQAEYKLISTQSPYAERSAMSCHHSQFIQISGAFAESFNPEPGTVVKSDGPTPATVRPV